MATLYRVMYSYVSSDKNPSIQSDQGYFVGEDKNEALTKARQSGMITPEVPEGSIKVWKVSEPLTLKLSSAEDNACFSIEPEIIDNGQGKKTLEYRVVEKK